MHRCNACEEHMRHSVRTGLIRFMLVDRWLHGKFDIKSSCQNVS